MNKTISYLITLLLGMTLGVGAIWVYLQQQHKRTPETMVQPESATNKPLYYRNPMNPSITSPMPAKDHMGMDYIPVYDDNAGDDKAPMGTVKINPATQQNIGVRVAEVIQEPLSHRIRTVGKVTYDEEHISRIHPKTEGWIEKLFIDKTGTKITKNTMLLSIYSPQLVTSAQEYLLAQQSIETLKESPFDDIRLSAQKMADIARERLELLDVPQHQIKELENNGEIQTSLHIHSPFNGTVINIGAREGQYVTPQTELYMLADLSKVWVIAQVYESDLPWVAVGDSVEMTLTGVPGQTFNGHLSYIYPYAQADTRSIKVRMVFDNPDMLLKPEMFANITINTRQQKQAITVPTEAIVRSGNTERLFVVRAPGQFEPREIKTGLTADGRTQIIDGVSLGEKVVSSSQFLIDSESTLRESAAKMLAMPKDKALPPSMDNEMELHDD